MGQTPIEPLNVAKFARKINSSKAIFLNNLEHKLPSSGGFHLGTKGKYRTYRIRLAPSEPNPYILGSTKSESCAMRSAPNEAYKRVLDRIEAACTRSGRNSGEVTVVGVTKGHPREILSKARALGLRNLGENRVQEALEKYSVNNQNPINSEFRLHLIGHLQKNKVRRAVELFDSIDTIDDLATAVAIDKFAGIARKRPRVLVQVNSSREAQKSGIAPEFATELACGLLDLKNIDFQGFMTIGPLEGNESAIRRSFADLRTARDSVCQELKIQSLPVLSMGMSGDFELAIEEGATEIRLGTILWGPRNT